MPTVTGAVTLPTAPVTLPTEPVTLPTAPVTEPTLPVRLPVNVVVSDVVTVVAALVPAMNSPPAAPGTALARPVRPSRTLSVGSAAVVTMFTHTGMAPVAVNMKDMLLPLVSAWLMAYLYEPVPVSSVDVPPPAANVPSMQRRTAGDKPVATAPDAVNSIWKQTNCPETFLRYI